MNYKCKYPQWDDKELIEHVDSFGKGLTKWEVDFIASFIDHPHRMGMGCVSGKQRAIIERIYEEKC